MSKFKENKKKLQSKIECIKKINDDPKGFTESTADKYLKKIPSTEDFVGKKLDALKEKRAQKKENKKDISAKNFGRTAGEDFASFGLPAAPQHG